MRRTNSKTLLFQPSVSLVKLQAAKEEETTTKDTNEIIKIKTLNIIKQAIRYHQDIPEWGVPAINTQNTRILTYLQSFLRVHRTMGDLPLTISRFCLFATCEGEEPSLSCYAVNGRFFLESGEIPDCSLGVSRHLHSETGRCLGKRPKRYNSGLG